MKVRSANRYTPTDEKSILIGPEVGTLHVVYFPERSQAAAIDILAFALDKSSRPLLRSSQSYSRIFP